MMNFPIKLSDLASDFTLHLSYLHSALNNPALLLSQINKIALIDFSQKRILEITKCNWFLEHKNLIYVQNEISGKILLWSGLAMK